MLNPNVALLTAVLSIIAIMFSIFSASWLNQRATERLIDDLKKSFDQRITDLEKRFDERFKAIDERFKAIEQRLATMDTRMDRIERQLEAIFKPSLPPRT